MLGISRNVFILIVVLATTFTSQLYSLPDAEKPIRYDTITAVVLRDMRPNSFINRETNKVNGFSVELTNAIASRCGYKVKYVLVNDWKEAENTLKLGKADICPVFTKTKKRLGEFLFSEPVEVFNISVCVRAKNRDIIDTADVSGKIIGVIRASQAYELLKNRNDIRLVEFDLFQSAILELLAGHIDVFAGPDHVIRNIASESGIESFIRLLPEPLKEVKRYFAYNINKQKLYGQINREITEFISSDDYYEIFSRWILPPKPYWTVTRVLIWVAVAFVFFIFMALFLHNLTVVRVNTKLKRTIVEKEKAHERLKEVVEEIQNINTQLEEAKNRLEESEENYKQALDDLNKAQFYSKIGSWKWLLKENRMEWSDEMYRIFEINKDNFNGSIDEIIQARVHPDDIPTMYEYNRLVIENGTPIPLEYRLVMPDGRIKTIWGEAGEIIKDDNGNQLYLVGIAQDITERKLAEVALENEKEKFRKIFESAPVAITISDFADGTYIEVNDAGLQFSGYSRGEVIGRRSVDIGWIDKENRELLINSLKEKGKIENIEIPFKNKKGDIVYGLVNGDIIFLNKRKCLLILTSDVTERRKHEESIRKLSSAIDCAKASIVITGYDGNIEYANPYFIEHTGYTPEEFIGQNPRVLKSNFHPPEFYKKMWDTIKSGNKWEDEIYNRKKNGEYYWETAIISPVFDTFGNITNFVAVKFDITENKRITDELIAAKEKAEESDRFKTAFLHNLSHEIRTPLNAILGFSEVIVKYYNDKPKIEYFSNIIIQRGNDLLEMIDGILDVARIESGKTKVISEPCSLNLVLLELEVVFKEHRMRFQKQEVDFVINEKLKKEKAVITTDPGKLKQILINLINNAFKFTDKGKVEVGYTIENNIVTLFVSDTGIGIAADKQKVIFERFVQLIPDKSKVVSGTGLGLSIAKGLTELLGGKIWVESEPGKGSVFFVELPCKSNVKVNLSGEEATEDFYSNLSGKVLIVEDDDLNTVFLSEILVDTQFEIVTTKFGGEAIELSKKHNFDVVLMDIGLPDMLGYEAVKKILAFKPATKIIAQTAYASPADRERALESGCIDYISKPIKGNLLLQKIKNVLG